jgi:drug/metabolite transporter (DMT)-like permease
LAVSAAAIFIRLAEAPAIAVAFWRCALAVVVLLPLAIVRREQMPRGRTLWVLLSAGVVLGGHFGFWISSLDYTSVAASVVLVTTMPIFVAILAYLVLGERTSPMSFAGILVAIAGTVMIAQDGSVGSAAFLGNALALIGAIMVAVYVLIGRSQRSGAESVGVLPYVIVVYSSASVTLLIVALISGIQMWGYSGNTWFWLWCIALGPQIMGHTVFNWALRYVEAAIVSGTVLAEPVIAASLAWLVLAEKPGLVTAVGGAVILAGVYLLLLGRRAPQEPVV